MQVVNGDIRAEAEEIVKMLNEAYKLKLDALNNIACALRNIVPDLFEVLQLFFGIFQAKSREIVQALEELLREKSLREDDTNFDKVSCQIKKGNELVAMTDEFSEKIYEFCMT